MASMCLYRLKLLAGIRLHGQSCVDKRDPGPAPAWDGIGSESLLWAGHRRAVLDQLFIFWLVAVSAVRGYHQTARDKSNYGHPHKKVQENSPWQPVTVYHQEKAV
jgi:hypothetical protein